MMPLNNVQTGGVMREKIMDAATALIEEKGERLEEITVREICARAGVGLGLCNYYFKSKEKLIEACVERIVNKIVKEFEGLRERTGSLSPFEALEELGYLTLTFLCEHEAVSRISMLSDFRAPKEDDNTRRTCRAYEPLVAACRPELSPQEVSRLTFALISSMQSAFLRREVLLGETGTDLKDPAQRRAYHRELLALIVGGEK